METGTVGTIVARTATQQVIHAEAFTRDADLGQRFGKRSLGRPIGTIETDDLDTRTLVLSRSGIVGAVVVVGASSIAVVALILLLVAR